MNAEVFDHYIPIPKPQLVAALVEHEGEEDAADLRKLHHWLGLFYHVQFFEQLEKLKDKYEPFNPDKAGPTMIQPNPAAYRAFRDEMDATLVSANFQPLPSLALHAVDPRTGRLAQKVKLPKLIFRDLRFYARGARERQITKPGWLGLPFGRKRIKVLGYDNVLLAATACYGMPDKLRKSARLRPGAVYLKLFRDIPQGDLLTLVPHARLSMPWRDRMFLGVPALIAGVPLLLKVVPAVSVMLLFMGTYLGISGRVEEDTSKQAFAAAIVLGGLIGFMMRQWTSFDRTALRNQKQVVDNAYFNKLNTNAGCFDYMIGTAEESELSEIFLAYAFLRKADAPLTRQALDEQIECWIEDRFGTRLDFEIDDALGKLRRLQLVSGDDEALLACDLPSALDQAASAWHNLADSLGMGAGTSFGPINAA